MTRPLRRLGIRARLELAVVAAVAAAIALLVVAFNLVLSQRLSANATDLARTRAAAQLPTLNVEHGRIKLGESPDEGTSDAQVWIFADGALVEAPRAASPEARAAAARLAASGTGKADVPGKDLRLVAVPVAENGRRIGAVVAGVSLSPYEETRETALIASALLAAVVLAAVAAVAWWMLARALRPVAQMTADAAAWSERDLDRRFAPGEPHDELTTLAATLDGLLDRLAASLRHEQRFAAELSHELRTPLSRITAEAELALKRERPAEQYQEALETIARSAAQMTRTVDALVAAARQEAGLARSTSDLATAIAQTLDESRPLAEALGLSVAFAPPQPPMRVGVDQDLVARILQPLVENACHYARSNLSVAVRRNGTGVEVTVEDDGPGVTRDELERIFEPGTRGSAAATSPQTGAGLGLALARRLARAAGGEVVADAGTTGGRFLVRLPAA